MPPLTINSVENRKIPMQLQTEVPKEGKLIERSLLSGDRLPLLGREKLWALGAKLQKACSPPRAAASFAASRCFLQLRFAHRMSLNKAEKFYSKNFCYSLILCTISRNPVISKQKESDQSSYMLIKRRIKKPPYHFSKKKKRNKIVPAIWLKVNRNLDALYCIFLLCKPGSSLS